MLALGPQHTKHAKKPSLSGKSVCSVWCTHVYKTVYCSFAMEKTEAQAKLN